LKIVIKVVRVRDTEITRNVIPSQNAIFLLACMCIYCNEVQ